MPTPQPDNRTPAQGNTAAFQNDMRSFSRPPTRPVNRNAGRRNAR